MSQEGFANLDVYEGVPHHYVRQDVTISLRDAGLRSPHLTSLAAPACDMFCLRSLGAEGMNGRPRAGEAPAVAYVAVTEAKAHGLVPRVRLHFAAPHSAGAAAPSVYSQGLRALLRASVREYYKWIP